MGVNPVLLSEVALPSSPGEVTQVGKAYGCAPALFLSELTANTGAPCVVLVPSVAAAESLAVQLQFFSGGKASISAQGRNFRSNGSVKTSLPRVISESVRSSNTVNTPSAVR